MLNELLIIWIFMIIDIVCEIFYLCCYLQVLQISDILKHKGACNDRSVIILLVFLASQLIVKKNMVIQDIFGGN